MQTRKLGQQGLEVGAIGLGTMGMTMAYGGQPDEEQSIATIRRAHELGVTLFDTAELYGFGTGLSEQIVGRAVAPFRDEVVIATKFGFDLGVEPERMGMVPDSRPAHVRSVIDQSLRDLGVDHIDVLYQHRVDPAVPIEDVAGVVKEAIEAGKVRFFGLSETGPETVRRAHAVQPVSVLQTEYSLFEREVEADVLPAIRELGIGFVPYSPLGRGFLTGAIKPAGEYDDNDMRNSDARWQPGNFERNRDAVARLGELAERLGCTTPQLALAWLLAQGDDIAPIPGTRSTKRLAENLGAADVRLTTADLAAVHEILPQGAHGSRYADEITPEWV